jgi:hypothetical protein
MEGSKKEMGYRPGSSGAHTLPHFRSTHSAALSLKRLCRQAGKPLLPLRSSSMASLLQGLRSSGLLQSPELGEET